MQNSIPLLFLFISAMVTENLIFARAIGIDEITAKVNESKRIILYCAVLLFICLPSVAISYTIKYFLIGVKNWMPFRGIIAVLAVSICFLLECFIFNKLSVFKKFSFSSDSMIYLAFSCTSISAILFSLQFTALLQCLVYCLGSCIGVMFAMLLLHSGKERLELSNVSKAFQGLPITLIYIGILSMAIYGLVGHKLLA